MKSTPAVLPLLRTPVMSAPSSPCIDSPEIFHNAPYPWAEHTPENSPRSWGNERYPWADYTPERAPAALAPSPEESRLINMWAELQSHEVLPQQKPVEPVVPRDLLRVVCEPFFEQMLTALEQSLTVTQKQQDNKDAPVVQAMTQTKLLFEQMLAALPNALTLTQKQQQPQQQQHQQQQQQNNEDAQTMQAMAQTKAVLQALVQQSQTTADREARVLHDRDCQAVLEAMTRTKLSAKAAAFQSVFCPDPQNDPMLDRESTEAASLLSGRSEAGSIDGDSKSSETNVVAPEASTVALSLTSQEAPLEKNTTVCRHWRSKGFCRMQETGGCKFSHPEHKRGVAATCASKGDGASDDRMNRIAIVLSNAINTEGEVRVTKRKTTRGGKKNRLKEKAKVKDKEEDEVQCSSPPGSWH